MGLANIWVIIDQMNQWRVMGHILCSDIYCTAESICVKRSESKNTYQIKRVDTKFLRD